MEVDQAQAPRRRWLDVVTVGFGTTVAMWGAGYVGRLPAIPFPGPVLFGLLLACLVGGGFVLGRRTGLGWRHGALAGLVCGTLNLLVLGSFLGGTGAGKAAPSALVWLPGSMGAAAALVAIGAAAGSRRGGARVWPFGPDAFARVAVAAAAFLLAVGGVVTSAEAGLAVVDWPNSFGYNMFLYPFSRMTGGIYYEHAHRLFGALVGLTTVALALVLERTEPRTGVRAAGWLAVAMVVVQGVLGGLRVTGGFTLSMEPADMRPSLMLAMLHGVLGQVFFATLVVLAVLTSGTWRELGPPRIGARADRWQCGILVVLLLGQLVLGAAQRHGVHPNLLMAHIGLGIAAVVPLAIHVGFRAWGTNDGVRVLQRAGLALAAGVGVQLVLGLASYAVTSGPWGTPGIQVVVTTAHQWLGAVLLGLAVTVWTLYFRVTSAHLRSNGPRATFSG